MTTEPADRREEAPGLQRAVAAAALGVLVFSSGVGMWMATLLVAPKLGTFIAPFTYGRWAPLHLDLQLYGWCSLPLIGILLHHFLPPTARALFFARFSLAAWLGALAAGALSWLGGDASGKLFLDWKGAAGLAFAGAQLLLWSVLAAGRRERTRLGLDSRLRRMCDLGLLLVLLIVPIALHIAERPETYPPVNPDSGGATGHSLLLSTLGIVAVGLVLPHFLSRPLLPGWKRAAVSAASLFAASLLVYLAISHGHASNRESGQIGGLASLLVWPPVLFWWYRRFSWEASHRLWIIAAAAWSVLLVLDGFILFLPAVLELAKFTNALVAHSHLAMAGLLTSLNMLMLVSLAPHSRLSTALAERRLWITWNAGCLAMVVTLTVLGLLEGQWLKTGYSNPALVRAVFILRWVEGAAMLAAALLWFRAAWPGGREREPALIRRGTAADRSTERENAFAA